MSPRNTNNSSFPTVPPALSTGDHGMRDHYDVQGSTAHRPAIHSLEDITPYLGLRARLSQVWLNRWTVLLLLILARVLLAIGSINDNLDSAKIQALSACASVESMGSAMASMPHYMAQGTNELAAKGVEKAVNGLQEMLFMAVTAVEEIFVFVVNVMYGTYECLITFAVGGAAHVAVKIAEDVTKFLSDSLPAIGKEIHEDVDKFQSGLNDFLKGLSSIPNVFGANVDPPKLDIPGLSKLDNLKLPDGINEGLDKMNASIPSFEEVHNFTNNVLRMPFEEVKKLMNASLGEYKFDRSVFPVPEKKKLSFCSDDDGINAFFDSLYKLADTAKKVFIGVLALLAILACAPMAWLEIRRWRTMQQRATLVSQNSLDPLDVVYITSRPYTAGAGLKVSRNFASPKRRVLTRWFVAYITSTPALFVLSLALAGLISCLGQYILLQAIRKEVPGLSNQVGAFADKVVTSLDDASLEWSNGTNTAITTTNKQINDDVFGWVNTSTVALNDTLNTFIKETTKVLDEAFNGTVLRDPVQQVFDCLIGLKVQNIEKGLTWIKDHAHIDFPLFPNNTFSDGAQKAVAADNGDGTNASGDSFLADPGSDASDKITAAVLKLTDKFTESIRTEALISTAVLFIWIIVVLMGLARVLFKFCTRDKLRAEGGVSFAGDINNIDTQQQRGVIGYPAAPPSPRHGDGFDRWHADEKKDARLHQAGPSEYGVVDEKSRNF